MTLNKDDKCLIMPSVQNLAGINERFTDIWRDAKNQTLARTNG
jgi:hypothetical protein